jgi:hypothetical protein
MKLNEPVYIEEEVMCEEDAGLLNASPVWMEPARDLCIVAADLLSRIYRIYMTQVKAGADAINWGSIAKNSKEFKRYVEATGELQNVELKDIHYAGRLAFWINIYNTLMLHQHVIMVRLSSLLNLQLDRDLQIICTEEGYSLVTVNIKLETTAFP